MPTHKADRFHQLYNHPKHTKRSLQDFYKFIPLRNDKVPTEGSEGVAAQTQLDVTPMAPYQILLKRRLLASESANEVPQYVEVSCRELGIQTLVVLGAADLEEEKDSSTMGSGATPSPSHASSVAHSPRSQKSRSSNGDHPNDTSSQKSHQRLHPSVSASSMDATVGTQAETILSFSSLIQQNLDLEEQLKDTEHHYIAMAKKEEMSRLRRKEKIEELKWLEQERMKRLKDYFMSEWQGNTKTAAAPSTISPEEQMEKKWKELHQMLTSIKYDKPKPSLPQDSPARPKPRREYLKRIKPRPKPAPFKRVYAANPSDVGILNDLVVDDFLLQEVKSIKFRGYQPQYRMDASVIEHLKRSGAPPPKKKKKKKVLEKNTIGCNTESYQWNRYQVRNLLPKLIRKLDRLKQIDQQKELEMTDEIESTPRISLTEREEREAREYRISNIIQFFADNEEQILEQLSEETDLTAHSDIDFNMLPKVVRDQFTELKTEVKQKRRALKDLHQLLSRLQANAGPRGAGIYSQTTNSGDLFGVLGGSGVSAGAAGHSSGGGSVHLPKISIVGGEDFDIKKTQPTPSPQRSDSPSKGAALAAALLSRFDPERRKLHIQAYTFGEVSTETQDLSMIPYDVVHNGTNSKRGSLMWHPSKGYTMRM